MVPTTNLLAFSVAALILILIPGPSVLFAIARSLSLGPTAGMLSATGNALGVVPHVVGVSLGLGALIAQSVVLFTAVKVAGAAYLVYLGVQAIRHRHVDAAPGALIAASPSKLLREGFLVGFTNPKTVVFLLAVLPQFVAPAQEAVALQMATLGAIFLAIAVVCDCGWAVLAGNARVWLARSPRRLGQLGGFGGVMMVGLGGALLFTGRHA
ncbi:LysE family translocator [soil metagenome]